MGFKDSLFHFFFVQNREWLILRPVPKNTRLDTIIGMESTFLNGQSLSFLSNEPFEKKPRMTIHDCDSHSEDHFEFIFAGTGCNQVWAPKSHRETAV